MSKKMPSRRQWFGALACMVVGVVANPGWSATPKIDLLEQSSLISPKWRSLVMLDVARAGTRLVSVGERGVVVLSDDHAKSWRQVKVPVSNTLTRVRFADDRTGWVIGHGGVILKTLDGGDTWVKQFDGVAAAASELISAKASLNGSAASQRRLDEAQRLVSEGPDKPFLAIQFADAKRGVVAGAYGLAFKTLDGGSSWQSMVGELEAADRRHLYAVLATDAGMLMAGEQGVMVSSRTGEPAYSVIPLPAKSTIFGMLNTAGTVIAYGLKGGVFRRHADGSAWTRIELPQLSFTAGLRVSNGDLLLGNEAGQLFISRDDGVTFRPLPVRNQEPISGLVEAADGSIVRAGPRGVNRVVFDVKEQKQ